MFDSTVCVVICDSAGIGHKGTEPSCLSLHATISGVGRDLDGHIIITKSYTILGVARANLYY